ncbi:MAG: DNA-3-methyladenine glycosylase I [Candidatus Adiutrix sp.]|jgi:DNA-3-methyladenine glycosylase I|nr:DNA-3-methyladenine glycosylase I [Candidatus Adiutrix sp.]
MSEIHRCPWGDASDALMRDYHDNEWGKPCRDERRLFEMLTLEGAQAGLSWRTILHKREAYKAAFDDFDVAKVAAYDESKIAALLQNPGLVRNRLKIRAAVTNAQALLRLGSLSDFIWGYVDGKPVVNAWERQEQMPATSPLSDKISRDMKKLGFKFVGGTIVYSYLQAVGVVNDHLVWCGHRGI